MTEALQAFRKLVLTQGRELYRDLPWRRTRDAYAVWISEVMLQQTQVSRVDGRWQSWLERFPTLDALAVASRSDVLEEWQGLGYNRRALSLLQAAQTLVEHGGNFPSEQQELEALPGIGPATAAGIRAFAFNLPAVYLETNVRSVFLHELFPDAAEVPDKELIPLVEACCPKDASDPEDDPRTWYYALLDYGAHIKQQGINPNRRSKSYARQSSFEGSRRQKRAGLVRNILAHPAGISTEELCVLLSNFEEKRGRAAVSLSLCEELLQELEREGFCKQEDGLWLS